MAEVLASGAAGAATAAQPQRLPALRDDLRLYEAPSAPDGSPTWTVHDPVRGSYFRIGYTAFRLLTFWRLGVAERVLAAANAGSTVAAGAQDLETLLRFLQANNLLAGGGGFDSYRRQLRTARRGMLTRVLHGYLFFRVPLLRPDRFLVAGLPLVQPLLTRGFLVAALLLGLVGLVLVLRQWDRFTGTFLHFLSLDGLLALGATLIFAKVLHELGHAFMARRFGCRVRTMGVALIVLWPVLYTDTTNAWRLVSRRQRLLIGGAGILTELCLACLATFAWSFLPDGPLRSVAFLLATVTWVTTLAINLNPLMRFDGYYLLADWMGVDNLQARSFALARWRLRELLFGFGEPPPERLEPGQRLRFLVFAYATWVWRFFLFLGLALLVYHLFFKALGIVLMVVELAWFIAFPVFRELREWWRRRAAIRPNRNLLLTLVLLGGALWLLASPWQTHLMLPAVLEARQVATLYPPSPARLARVVALPGETVAAGDLLFDLEAPDLERELQRARGEVDLVQRLILRQAASSETLEQLGVLERELAEKLARLRGLQAERDRLAVVAPFAGRLADVPPGTEPGLWLAPSELLGRVVGQAGALVEAYVASEDLGRLRIGAAGRFYPEDPAQARVAVTVAVVDSVGVAALETPYLSSEQGGDIAVRADARQRAVPEAALYRVTLHPRDGLLPPAQVQRGTVRVEAEAISPLARLWRTAAAVLIRESGF